MKNSIGIIAFIIVVLLAVAYLFLGSREEGIQRPTRIAKRVKIEVPPPAIIPDITESTESFEQKEKKKSSIDSSINEPKKEEVIPKIEDNRFQEEKKPVKKPDEKEVKQATQKQIISSRTPQMLVAPLPESNTETLWVVNIVSLRSRSDAKNLIDKLKSDSYNAYLTEFDKDNTRWYRVRVGFFSEKQKAEKMGQDISNSYRLGNYWVVKPSKKEILANR
jgi:DedD protein